MFDSLPLAYCEPVNSALFRQQPEHFQVDEELSFSPCGEGDHLYLKIQKRNTNTDWLARQLATIADLRPVDIGYAGRKDRFALTSQWFSLHLPGLKAIDRAVFQADDYHVIEHSYHTRKLRKGELEHNQFKLQLINFTGCFEMFEKRVKLLSKTGFPNYFGPQRFGHQSGNIDKARQMLSGKMRVKDRNKRSIYLSAARSFMFNMVLAKRIENNSWQMPINGDRFWDIKEQRLTDTLPLNDALLSRLEQGQQSITGPLPGDGNNSVADDALLFETEVLSIEQSLCDGIANSRIRWQRRPLRVIPGNLQCRENNLGVELEFSLSPGAYATSLLRELVCSEDY